MVPPSVSVVIPVYNGAASLAGLVGELQPLLAARGVPFEALLVNDGSRDNSWEVITRLSGEWPGVVGVNLSRNFGQHNALLCGIRCARHDVIVTMDDDGQHPPAEIPRLLAELARGFDVVYGWPDQAQHSRLRNMASLATKVAVGRALGHDIARRMGAFRAFRTRLRDAFSGYRGPYVSIDVLLSWATTQFSYIPTRHEPRQHGVSGYTLRKLMRHALNIITGFSTLPLRLSSILGGVSILFGLAVLVFVIGRYFLDPHRVPGFPFLASIIVIFSGVNLISLGVIGEYLAHLHFRTMDQPSYVVSEVTEVAGGGNGHVGREVLPITRVG